MGILRISANRRATRSGEPLIFEQSHTTKKGEGKSLPLLRGGDMGIRTPDLYVANVSRYQLCYIPVCWWEQQDLNL